MNNDQLELARKMATPTRLGATIGKEFMGEAYVPYHWTLYAERRVLNAMSGPGKHFVILNLPPQVGKTTWSGMLLPSWYLGMNPYKHVLFIAYHEDYAASWGGKCRALLKRYGKELFQEEVSTQIDARGKWAMSNGFGGMQCYGITGGITGNPGDLIIIDDVIKTMEDATSTTTKDKQFAEYEGSITTRFQENTTVLITATRWADDDLSGRLITRQQADDWDGDRYEVISIPAFAEPPEELAIAATPNEDGEVDEVAAAELEAWCDELGRRNDEALECRFTREHFESRRRSTSTFVFSALYQQNPTVREGGMFPRGKWKKWFRADPTVPRFIRFVRAWDLATIEGGGDWTVGTKMALAPNGDLYIIERERFRLSSGGVNERVKAIAAQDGFQVKIIIEQEKAGAGHTVVENYKRELRGYLVEAGKVEGTKEQRATPYSIMQNQGRVWLPGDNETLCKEWIDEHRQMMGDGRRPRHDDQIDTGAYCALDLLSNSGFEMYVPGLDPTPGDENGDPLPNDEQFLAVLTGANPFFG